MKRNQINELIPKVSIAIIVSILVALVIIGIYRDSTGELCNGFMGTKASCVEETAFWPYGLISVALLGFFGAWWGVNRINNTIKSKKAKRKK